MKNIITFLMLICLSTSIGAAPKKDPSAQKNPIDSIIDTQYSAEEAERARRIVSFAQAASIVEKERQARFEAIRREALAEAFLADIQGTPEALEAGSQQEREDQGTQTPDTESKNVPRSARVLFPRETNPKEDTKK